MEKEDGMKEIRVRRDGLRDLSFLGKELSWASTQEDNRDSRWEEYHLYQTKGGKYVIAREYYTLWQGETNHYEGWIGETLRQVFQKAFDLKNPSRIAKELADGIIDLSERIE